MRDLDAVVRVYVDGTESDLMIEAAAVLIYVARRLAYNNDRSEQEYITHIVRIAMADSYDGSKRRVFEEMGVDATTMLRLFG